MTKLKYRLLNVALLIFCILTCVFAFASVFSLHNGSKIEVNAQVDINEVQRRLKDWGYYNGPVNGQLDNATKEAIKYFQRKHNVEETGDINGITASLIGVYYGKQMSYETYLLAKCIHAEARGESYVGKVAVGAVILNRVKNADYPNTIYGVIYQPWAFTAVHDGQINLEPNNEAYQAAMDALNGWDPTHGALFYYNPNVATNKWIFSRPVVTVIGNHVFAV